jgi:uncharacterized damage-inducible protein DinB
MMHVRTRAVVLAGGMLLSAAPPLAAQAGTPVLQHLIARVEAVETKLVGLATAMPEASFAWRPMEGVRSVAEVFVHVVADNYLLPAFDGPSAPSETGIDPDDYATVQAYEARQMTQAEIVAALEASFAHLKDAMTVASSRAPDRELSFFGRTVEAREMWVLTVTHLHEHLGQSIAYARANGIVPPWSRGGN